MELNSCSDQSSETQETHNLVGLLDDDFDDVVGEVEDLVGSGRPGLHLTMKRIVLLCCLYSANATEMRTITQQQ